MRLSIVVPAYNEEMRLGAMMDVYTAYFFERYGDEVEFIIVVNGSRDNTEGVADTYAIHDPRVRVLVEPQAIGKGGAIMLGAEAARGEWIGFVDADGATPPESFDDLVTHVGEAGAIIASRWIPGAVVDPPQPLKRRVASRLFNFLVRWFFKVNISDTQCGAKVIKGEAMRTILPRLGLTRWAFDVDLLFQLRRAGYRITEHPTVWRDVSGSQLKIIRASWEMFLAICRLRLLNSPFKWIVDLYDVTLAPVVKRIKRM